MKSLFYKIGARVGAFIGVMAFCYGMVMAGAWYSSVIKPTLSVSLPSFDVAVKALPARMHFQAKKTDPCPLPPDGVVQASACETEKHMCGRHDVDSCGATSLYCGCHAHDGNHPGTATSGAPDSLPSSVAICDASHVRLPVPDEVAVRELLLAFKSERPPSASLV